MHAVIVLHAIWSSGTGVCVWGEDSTMPVVARRPPGRPPRVPRPGPHPFACNAEQLREALPVAGGEEGEITLRLPSTAAGPACSPQVLRDAAGGPPASPVELRPWIVPVLAHAAVSWPALLPALPETSTAQVRVADSARFVSETYKLALELMARGRVLPSLRRHDDGWVAVWRPVTTAPADAARVRLLHDAMPAIICSEDGERPPRPGALLEEMLEAFVDASARHALTRPLPASGLRSPAGGWLAALGGPNRVVRGDDRALAAVAEEVEAWHASAERYEEHRMFRTCFRLSEPDTDTEATPRWRVDFLLQAKDDPSVMVPAAEVWRSNGDGLRLAGRRIADAQERLLGGLGHALREWPELESALREPAPDGVDLDTDAAMAFVRDVAGALEQDGFGVLVPSWWRQRLRVSLRAEPMGDIEEGSGLFSLDGLCRFEWQVAIGDHRLTLAELRELATLKLPVVMSRGQWIMLAPEDVEAALAFLSRRDERGRAPAAEILRTGLGLDVPAGEDVDVEVDARGWLAALMDAAQDGRGLQLINAPCTFAGELRPYQQRGVSWLAFLSGLGLGACLADDMGLGKTVQLLALLLAEREAWPPAKRRRHPPTLLICPMSVTGNWEREAQRFAPSLGVIVHHGPGRLDGPAFARAAARSDLVITTYALALRDRDRLATVAWDRVVLDEAQHIKTIDTKQTRAIRALPARHRVALTGTPVENRLTELHSLLDFLNPGMLGPAATFKRSIATPIERFRDPKATARLRRATAPFILRRLKTDRSIISDLPDKLEMRVDCQLTREQATLYQAVVEEMLDKAAAAEGIERSAVILGALTKLKQVCNHPAHLLKDRSALPGRSGKLTRVEELLAEAVGQGDRALCFTQFTEFGHMLQRHLQERLGTEVMFLHGGTRKSARDEMVERFQGADGPSIFVLSLKAGGTGLNLTAANHVVHVDRWWNPAVEDQATDRAFRIGQTKTVQVRKLTCVGTVEERIDALIAQKKDLAERVVGAGDAWVTELDTEQLRALVTLSAGAVGE
jgi:superfamily II DNA or RNA helicase